MQLTTYVAGNTTALIDSDPLALFVPDHPPDAVQEVAFVDVQDMETEEPLETFTGPSELLALMLTVGGMVQDSVVAGLPIKDPHPLESVQVLACWLFVQVPHDSHVQFGEQLWATV